MAKAELFILAPEILMSDLSDVRLQPIVPAKKATQPVPQAPFGHDTGSNRTHPEEQRRRRNFSRKTHPG